MSDLNLLHAPIDPLFNTPIDPDQCPPHWSFSIPPLSPHCSIPPLTLTNAHWPFSIPPLTLTNAPIDPDQRLHWPFSIPPLTLTNAPHWPFSIPHWPWPMPPWPFSIPPLTLTNARIDPFQYPHWPWPTPIDPDQRLHWLWPTPPLALFNTPTDPDQCPIDPFQCHHWPFLHAPNAPIDPTQYPCRIFSMPPLTLSIPPLDFWHRHWKCPTPRLKFYPQTQTQLDTPPIRLDTPQTQLDTPQIWLDTPQIRLDTLQIRLNTTLNDKSNWIRTKFDWIRPLPPPKALNRRHWGFTGVQAVSWTTYATISTNSTKSQPNRNRKIATSPHKAKGKYVEEYMIYYVVALYIMYSNQKSYLDFHDWIEHWTSYI